MKESVVEQALCAGVLARGGVATKVRAIGRRGYFDRVVLVPGSRVWFVELKRPRGGRMAPHQTEFAAAYAALGAQTVVLRSLPAVQDFLAMLDKENAAGADAPAAFKDPHPPR